MGPAAFFHRLLALAGAIGAALTLAPGAALAQDDDFFRSSPGPLARSHASLDSQDKCNECHTGGRGLSNDKCLGCHDHSDLRDRIRAGKGYHASRDVKGKKCEKCHLEHKGRGFDLMGWPGIGGMNKFNHDLTGWPLKGKHAATRCEECHKGKNRQGLRTFLGENPLCGSCHKDDQPHGFKTGAKLRCDRCHGQSAWKPPKRNMDFDHDKKEDAAMALVGSHADVSCAKCHPKAQFVLKKRDPDYCGHCHNSPHDNHLFGKKACQWCHSPARRSLKKFEFNHSQRTRFDLGRSHGRLDCYKCHTKKQGTQRPDRACAVCHGGDNKHQDRFKQFGSPPRCEACHPSSGDWKSGHVFSHNRLTKFKLTGKHAAAKCRSCHRGKRPSEWERFDARKVGCMGCHAHKNVHDREWTDAECLNCHEAAGNPKINVASRDLYHGPKSRFPLVRKHKNVPCEKCHKNLVYKDTPRECGPRCHEDSLHRGDLGDACDRCHKGGTWEALAFDHTDDTKWPLRGLHKTVPACEDCHPKRAFSRTPTDCAASGCHAKDDAHKGKLGKACDRCHLETGDNVFNHNTMSDYALTGKHLTTRCSDCHPSVTFKPRPTNCFGCHPEPEVHKGQYGTLCDGCHTTASWVDIKALHDVGEFALKGAHDNLPCVRCHKDSRALAGSGNLCINCHRQDDIHSNSLSPRCGECHTQFSFAPARFDHTTVGCTLTGLHRTMPCFDCHKTGNFGGLSPQCFGCHKDTALQVGNVGGVDHLGIGPCSACHNPTTWAPADANGTFGYGRESICR